MTSALHAEGREFNPPLEYFFFFPPHYLCNLRQWCIGNIEASQALAPGSTPGWRILFACLCAVPGCVFVLKKKQKSLLAGLNHRPFAYKANALPLS